MARKVRLREFVVLIAVFPCFWAVSGGLRYGSKPTTLHTHKPMETEYMGQSVKVVNGLKYGELSKQHTHHRLRRDAPSHKLDFSAVSFFSLFCYQLAVVCFALYSAID